jgi:hypothetical protein
MNVNPFRSGQNPIRCDGPACRFGLLLKGVDHRCTPFPSPAAPFAARANSLAFVIVIYHRGDMRPKSVRRWVRSERLGSSTTGPVGPRQKTTQCQNERPRTRCHLIASSARSGNDRHAANRTSALAARTPNSRRSRRTYSVSDHSRGSAAKMPSRFATCFACR